MLGPVYKVSNMMMNLLPFALIIWGFQQMTWNTISAASVFTLRTWITEDTCGANRWADQCTSQEMCAKTPPADAFIRDCNSGLNNYPYDWDRNVQVTDLHKAEENWGTTGVAMVAVFSLFNVIWMALYLKNSGVLSYSFGTVGYHYKNVKALRNKTYKYFGYFLIMVLFGFLIFGINRIEAHEEGELTPAEEEAKKDQKSKMYTIYFNGVFQCLMGFMALLTTVPDTVEFGEKLMKLTVKSQPWQKSQAVMEKFQDALAAARAGDKRYLTEMTGCAESEVNEILADVTAIKYEISFFQKMINMILCKGDEKKDPRETEMTMNP